MHLCPNARPSGWAALFLLSCLALARCTQQQQPAESAEAFFTRQSTAHNGDYLATYPLHNPDSCIIRLKAEVPAQHQPWGCLSIWYHLPRTSPQVSFRLLELYDQHYPHDTVFAFTQMMRGEFLAEMRLHDSARTVLTDARSRYLRLHRPLDASDADYLMARCYNQENKVGEALESYFRVLKLINSHDTAFSHRHISLYFDIATAYGRNKDYTNNMFWLKKAQQGDSTRLPEAWKYHISIAQNMSANYAHTGKFDSSLLMVQGAISLYRAHVNKPVSAEMNYRLGFAQLKKGDCAAALPFLRQAEQRSINSANSFMKNQIEQTLGEAYFCLGRMDSSGAMFTRQSLATPDTGNLAAAHQRLAEIYARRGDYRAAYAEATRGIAMFKRFFGIERATAISEFDARYKTAQKERHIAELQEQQKTARLQALVAALALLLSLGFAISLFFRQRARRRILEQQNQLLAQEKELAEARERLKTQELERSQTELLHTQGELDTAAKLLVLKTEIIEELQMRLNHRNLAPSEASTPDSAASNGLRSMKILTDGDWVRFRERFDQQMPGVLQHLTRQHPDLTAAEIRLFLLLKLKFDAFEISEALGISKDSVYRSRHRLSKKLGLTETGELEDFVEEFG